MSKKTLILSDREFRLLREMCDSWIPATSTGKITKLDDKILTSIADKIQAIRDADCQQA